MECSCRDVELPLPLRSLISIPWDELKGVFLFLKPKSQNNSHIPDPSYRDSKSFLRICRLKMLPPCSQPLQTEVDYRFNKEFLKIERGSSVEVFFLVSLHLK